MALIRRYLPIERRPLTTISLRCEFVVYLWLGPMTIREGFEAEIKVCFSLWGLRDVDKPLTVEMSTPPRDSPYDAIPSFRWRKSTV